MKAATAALLLAIGVTACLTDGTQSDFPTVESVRPPIDRTESTATEPDPSGSVRTTIDLRPESIELPSSPIIIGGEAIISGPYCGETIRVTLIADKEELIADSGYIALSEEWEVVLPVPAETKPGPGTLFVSCNLDDRNSVFIREPTEMSDR